MCSPQYVTAQNVDIDVMSIAAKVSIQKHGKIWIPIFWLSQGVGQEAEGVTDAVHAFGVGDFGNRSKHCQRAILILSVHVVGSWGEEFASDSSIRSGSSVSTVYQVGCNGEDG